jgi:hypothetical protein
VSSGNLLRPGLRTRDAAFSYRCGACSRCCRGKRIQLSPYELARLAAVLETTTTDVISRYTRDGTALAVRPDDSCVFLGPLGCSVHAGRPLVCRLYPLGVVVAEDGREAVVELEPHPDTEGAYGTDGTVADYFAAQGAPPFFAAAARYHAVLQKLGSCASPISDGPSGEDDLPDVAAFLDPHLAVSWNAERGGPPVPAGVEELIDRHLALLEIWAARLTSISDP